jgi:hypothetical protein
VELEQDWWQEGPGSKGKQGSGFKGYTIARAGTSNMSPTYGLQLKTRRAQTRIGCGHAGCRLSGFSSDMLTAALSTSVGADKPEGQQALEDVQLIKRRTSLLVEYMNFTIYIGGLLKNVVSNVFSFAAI